MKPPVGDGLQATRTALSWRRTVASAGALTAIVAHHALTADRDSNAALLVAGTGVGLVALVFAAHQRGRRDHASPRLIRLTSTAVVLAAALALVATVR